MKHTVFLVFIYMISLCSCSPRSNDYLVYVINESSSGQGQLMLYAPFKDIHTPLLSDWDIDNLSVSVKNRLAFSSSREGNNSIYILDYPFTDNVPMNITPDISIDSTLFSWSPDGRHLAFTSIRTSGKALSIWDGENIFNIHHYQEAIGDIAWSPDGRLAFTEFYTFIFPYDGDQTEIFLWDGKLTTSVSQNPSGDDRHPDWSKDGQLAFLSNRDGEKYEIFVWDGVSKNNGIPIIELHKHDAQLIYYSSPTWTNSGSLTFCATSSDDEHHYVHIYEWNGQTTTNISQNPNLHSCGQTWRSDGYWSFVTFFSGEQLIYVRDNTNQTLLTTKGQYQPAWSQAGFLLFCVPESSEQNFEWVLSTWNGKEIIKIDQGYQINAVWKNGTSVFCSNG